MADPPDLIRLHDGSELRVLERPSGSDDPLVMRFQLVDGCGSPPPHIHPTASETFEVEQGSFELSCNGEWRQLTAGESLTVRPGERHTFRNRSGAPVTVRNVHDPHHGFEAYVRVLAALTREHETMAPTSPAAAMKFSLLISRHSDLIRPTDQPMRSAVPILAALARRLRLSLPSPT